MRSPATNRVLSYCTVLWYFSPLMLTQTLAQPSIQDSTALTLDDFEFNQFIASSGSTPNNILKLDNNGAIILACVAGKTREQLRTEGVEFVESQIKLMKTWRLLRENNKVLQTAFPILGATPTHRLRKYSAAIVPELSQKLRPEVLRFKALLDSAGRAGSAYTILFSYVLDDLAWDRFEETGLLSEREITAEKPFWAGEIWATYPPRRFSMGTNTISDSGVALKVNWTEKAIPKMIPFVADWKNFGRMFEDYRQKGRVENEEAKAVFEPFNLFDSSGYFTVPVILETPEDPVYKISYKISEHLASSVPKLLDQAKLAKEFNFRDPQQTLVIVYHELMWDLMDYWENELQVEKPVAFANPAEAEPRDIGDLVFIVKSSNK